MYIGVDIGGTKCAVVKADGEGHILSKVRFDTTTYKETLGKILTAVDEAGHADAIGISCGGPLDSKRGIILCPPNLPEWRDVEIVKILSERTGIPAFLQNDANACALAEFCLGAGCGCENMAFLTFGTGLGAGLILGGKLYDGTNGNAGELGHIRLAPDGPLGFGKRGSFEGFCSGGGLAQMGKRYAERCFAEGKSVSFCNSLDQIDGISAKTIAIAADAGNEDALEIYRECGRKLGYGLAILIDIINPERIVIGSIYTRSEHLLRDEMMRVLREEALAPSLGVCEILPAALGEQIGDLAAVSVAMAGLKS